MAVLYVTEQGAIVGRVRERLLVTKGNARLASVRLAELEQVALCGNVQLTTQAARILLARGIDAVFLNQGGAFLGRLAGPLGKNVELRRLQHQRLADPVFALDLARRFVAGKLANSRTLLQRHQRNRPADRIARALVAIRLLAEQLPRAASTAELLGLEGKAAAEYFGAFPCLLTAPGITFTGRKRRPPPDPVNILLSFGYTLLGNQVHGLCEQAGFDPYVGSLHALHYGRPSLALDLIEEMRPVLVDTTVLRVLNSRGITPADFVPVEPASADVEEAWERAEQEQEDGSAGEEAAPPPRRLLLRQDAVRRWLVAFERRLGDEVYYPLQDRRLSYKLVLREQVYLLGRHLRGEASYEPFAAPR